MAKHSIIDPVDRIEGHLRVEMEVENGVVTDAWVSGGLFRGLELIVEGRDPSTRPRKPTASRFPKAVAWYATSSRARSSCIATSCGSIS